MTDDEKYQKEIDKISKLIKDMDFLNAGFTPINILLKIAKNNNKKKIYYDDSDSLNEIELRWVEIFRKEGVIINDNGCFVLSCNGKNIIDHYVE